MVGSEIQAVIHYFSRLDRERRSEVVMVMVSSYSLSVRVIFVYDERRFELCHKPVFGDTRETPRSPK